MTINELKYKYKTSGIVIQLIVVNVAVFLILQLCSLIFGVEKETLASWFVLPEDLGDLILQPWSLITYAFVHFGFMHLLFNMLWLYVFGPFILNLFQPKRFLTIYLLGALCGGLLYVFAYNVLPIFQGQYGYLLGASAGVRAIVFFIAGYSPNMQMRIFTFNIKLWHIAAVLFALDVLQLMSPGNRGGMIAHIGGAALGYFYGTQLAKGNDIGSWFEKWIDGVSNMFKPKKEKPFKKVHKTRKTTLKNSAVKNNKTERQLKVDAILDKIGKSGYESLSKDEKDFLFKAGNE
ncbi:rhomboid family intramembrane serine protease [Patiriisocius marinistellae]|uniref:Rhomboid family intramembrane serine protease n=1 Tax=Patiriisocius marinistellae TaxID=2494560 RepID=A0A5J4G0W0_9FLAO|nr:rhomboid family intramembrane serine protease [Patiriisocius marinistellae]GEQ86086.1 rhomboid family intramembrane serine protease [Patiriisocius marinistellae]